MVVLSLCVGGLQAICASEEVRSKLCRYMLYVLRGWKRRISEMVSVCGWGE